VSTNRPALRFMGVSIGIGEIGVMPLHAIRSCSFESAEEWGKRIIYRIAVRRTIAREYVSRRATQRLGEVQDFLLLIGEQFPYRIDDGFLYGHNAHPLICSGRRLHR